MNLRGENEAVWRLKLAQTGRWDTFQAKKVARVLTRSDLEHEAADTWVGVEWGRWEVEGGVLGEHISDRNFIAPR